MEVISLGDQRKLRERANQVSFRSNRVVSRGRRSYLLGTGGRVILLTRQGNLCEFNTDQTPWRHLNLKLRLGPVSLVKHFYRRAVVPSMMRPAPQIPLLPVSVHLYHPQSVSRVISQIVEVVASAQQILFLPMNMGSKVKRSKNTFSQRY